MKNIFDVIKNLTYIKNENDLGTNLFNAYMINRYMSMEENYFIYALTMNRYFYIPLEYQEYFLYLTIPKRYVFLKYIKNKNKFNEGTQKDIQEKFNLSDKKTTELLEFMNKLNNIKNGVE